MSRSASESKSERGVEGRRRSVRASLPSLSKMEAAEVKKDCRGLKL